MRNTIRVRQSSPSTISVGQSSPSTVQAGETSPTQVVIERPGMQGPPGLPGPAGPAGTSKDYFGPIVVTYDSVTDAVNFDGAIRAASIYAETITAGAGGIASGAALKADGAGEFRSSDPVSPTIYARMAPAQIADSQTWASSSGTEIASLSSTGLFEVGSLRTGSINMDEGDLTNLYYLEADESYIAYFESNNIFANNGEFDVIRSGAIRNINGSATLGKHPTLDAFKFDRQVFFDGEVRSDYGFNPSTVSNGFSLTSGGLGVNNYGARMRIANDANSPAFHFHVGNAQNTSTLGFFDSSGAPSMAPLVARGAAGQSISLQAWQNSSGNVLAAIDYDGRIYNDGGGGDFKSIYGPPRPAIKAVNTGGGDSGSAVRVFEGYAQDGTSLTSWISVGGNIAGGAFVNISNTATWGWNGTSILTNTGEIDMRANGATINMRSPNGQLIKGIGLGNDGTFNLAANPVAPGWESADDIMLGIRAPGGSQRTAIYSSGRIQAAVHLSNGRAGHGAVTPLEVYHDGADNPSGNLIWSGVGAGEKFIVKKTGGAEVIASPAQSSDLQQWKNSSGSVLAWVTSSGDLGGQSITTNTLRVFGEMYNATSGGGLTLTAPNGSQKKITLKDDGKFDGIDNGGVGAGPVNAVRLFKTSNQSVSSYQATVLTNFTIDFNTGGQFEVVGGNQIKILQPGYYSIHVGTSFTNTSGSGNRVALIYKNGVNTREIGLAGGNVRISGGDLMYLVPNDVVSLAIYSDHSAVMEAGTKNTWLSIAKHNGDGAKGDEGIQGVKGDTGPSGPAGTSLDLLSTSVDISGPGQGNTSGFQSVLTSGNTGAWTGSETDRSQNFYTAPSTGSYLFLVKVRLTDGFNNGGNIGIGAGEGIYDSPSFAWSIINNSGSRVTYDYQRRFNLTQGQKAYVFTYLDTPSQVNFSAVNVSIIRIA